MTTLESRTPIIILMTITTTINRIVITVAIPPYLNFLLLNIFFLAGLTAAATGSKFFSGAACSFSFFFRFISQHLPLAPSLLLEDADSQEHKDRDHAQEENNVNKIQQTSRKVGVVSVKGKVRKNGHQKCIAEQRTDRVQHHNDQAYGKAGDRGDHLIFRQGRKEHANGD